MPSLKTILTSLALAAAATTTVFAAPAPHSARSHTGDMTYYQPGLGACGHTSSASDYIVAVSSSVYNGGAACGSYISISYQGESATVKVVDLCTGCKANDIDVSPAVFTHLTGSLRAGRVKVNWS